MSHIKKSHGCCDEDTPFVIRRIVIRRFLHSAAVLFIFLKLALWKMRAFVHCITLQPMETTVIRILHLAAGWLTHLFIDSCCFSRISGSKFNYIKISQRNVLLQLGPNSLTPWKIKQKSQYILFPQGTQNNYNNKKTYYVITQTR